jgi:hypothetical protein
LSQVVYVATFTDGVRGIVSTTRGPLLTTDQTVEGKQILTLGSPVLNELGEVAVHVFLRDGDNIVGVILVSGPSAGSLVASTQ